MFLQFFIWGSWFVTLGTYLTRNLGASGGQLGLAFATQSWGAILAPFIVGRIADRFFNAERMLAFLHLVGAAIMLALYNTHDFSRFYLLLLGYMIIYMPTLALVNTVAFRQMADPSAQFANVRVCGTIGWIIAGLSISLWFAWDSSAGIAASALRNTFLMSAIASLVLGCFALTLPRTAPLAASSESTGWEDLLGVKALSLLRDRNFLTFFVSSVLICIPLAFYYQNANQFLVEIHVANATGKQTIGQMSEVLFLLLLPLFLKRFGMKTTLMMGMLAWCIRYVLFAYGDAHAGMSMLLLGIALHGVCYDFFFVSGQIYTDSKAGSTCKSAAQGLITLATYGVGMLIGFWAAGVIFDLYATGGSHDWRSIWLWPAAFAAVVLGCFLIFFRNETVRYELR